MNIKQIQNHIVSSLCWISINVVIFFMKTAEMTPQIISMISNSLLESQIFRVDAGVT